MKRDDDAVLAALRGGATWIEWEGGECPVPAGTMVALKFGNGTTLTTGGPEHWRWTDTRPWRGSDYDIVAYFVVAAPPPPPAA